MLLEKLANQIKLISKKSSCQEADFLRKIYFQDLKRIYFFSIVIPLILIPIIYLDYLRLKDLSLGINLGAHLIFYAHISCLLIFVIFFLILKYKLPNFPEQINSFHKSLIFLTSYLFILSVGIVSVGKVILGYSIINYIGAISVLAITIYLPNGMATILLFSNSLILLFLIQAVPRSGSINENILINLSVYTLFVFISSRYIYVLKIKEFKADEKSRKREDDYYKIFNISPDPMVIHNGKEILEINDAGIKILGFKTADEVIGLDPSSFVSKSATEITQDRINKMMKDNVPLPAMELAYSIPGRGEVIAIATPIPISYYGEKAILINYHDITEQKKNEEMREKVAKALGVMEMAGAAAHELNQPLQNIVLMSELLLDSHSDKDDLMKKLTSIIKQVYKVGELTKNIQMIAQDAEYSTKAYVHGKKIIDIHSVKEKKNNLR